MKLLKFKPNKTAKFRDWVVFLAENRCVACGELLDTGEYPGHLVELTRHPEEHFAIYAHTVCLAVCLTRAAKDFDAFIADWFYDLHPGDEPA